MWDKLIDQAKSNLDKREKDWKDGLAQKMSKCPKCGKINCKKH